MVAQRDLRNLGHLTRHTLSVCEGRGEGIVTASALSLALIHPSAWKQHSLNFALTEFYEVHAPPLQLASWSEQALARPTGQEGKDNGIQSSHDWNLFIYLVVYLASSG